jgi:hypothetical protein
VEIRDEQLRSISATLDAEFESKLTDHIRRHHAVTSDGISGGKLRAKVRFGIERARERGLTWQSSIACFVGLMFEYGPSFSEHTLIDPYLRSPEPDLALDEMVDSLTDEQWEQVDQETPKLWIV